MKYASAKNINFDKIPIIDVVSLRNGKDKFSVAKFLHDASKNLGFIYIKNHGINENVIKNVRKDGLSFFRKNKKDKIEVKISKKHRGWLGYGGAKMHDNAKPDLKESFIWGYQDDKGFSIEDHPLRGKNLWPTSVPTLENSAMEFFEHTNNLARDLLKGFAIGLNLDEDFFFKSSSKPLSRASLVYYPSQPIDMGEDQFGVSSHTDFGVLTILCQDEVGGLQVQDLNGEWFHAPPIPNTIIVNVADLLSRWTGGEYKSTPHRVVNTSGKERLSIVLAFDPNPETIVDPNDVFGPTYKSNVKPITCGDYLIWRFGKAFSYRN